MAERPKWHKPSKYQLAFDYGNRRLEAEVRDVTRFTYEVNEEVKVLSPVDAGQYLLTRVFTPFEAFEQEEVWILLLNTRNKITHQSMIYRGTINMVNMRIGEIFKPALRYNASSIVVSHIHPSGDPTPSPEDIAVTQAMRAAGELLDVPLLDHLIIGQDCWLSLKTQGLGFDDAA